MKSSRTEAPMIVLAPSTFNNNVSSRLSGKQPTDVYTKFSSYRQLWKQRCISNHQKEQQQQHQQQRNYNENVIIFGMTWIIDGSIEDNFDFLAACTGNGEICIWKVPTNLSRISNSDKDYDNNNNNNNQDYARPIVR